MKHLFFAACSLLCGTTLLAPASAQWLARSGNPTRTVGNSHAEGAHEMYGVMVSSTTHAYVRTDASNDVCVFGSRRPAGDVSVEGYTNTRTNTSYAALRASIGNRQFANDRFTTILSRGNTWHLSVFPTPPQLTVVVAFLPVTLMVDAGARLSLGVSVASSLASNSVQLSGTTSATLYASAAVLVGLSVFGAGVEARLELGRTEIRGGLTARTGSLTDSLTASFSAFAVRLVAFVNVIFRLGEVTLVDVVGGQLNYSGRSFLN